jgi:AcrR family transcriptional regulator
MSESPAKLRKSERTRLAILDAAREHFAKHGYDRASLRAIATQARIDPSMIIRYYTNKETLFAAAVDVDLGLPDLREVPERKRGARLAEHFLNLWEGEDRNDVLPILLRSAITNEQAAERLRSVYADQVQLRLGQVAGAGEAQRRAGLVSSQLIGVALARYFLRLPGITDRPSSDLIADIAPTIQRYLTGKLASS